MEPNKLYKIYKRKKQLWFFNLEINLKIPNLIANDAPRKKEFIKLWFCFFLNAQSL